ncbi:hypothetical protein C6361_09745 [Plantactinospora sp. BC1]|uniref:hypothetical protein n=1 Tax=Plantactinospora sp. BC1 TaxID=2108470 RepID=UPI000D17AAEF|nr:hypothetical protein [Plantactinospora sp. BC1]AVT29724.1 hypothetical protein C6361_09745 [Plantactinospora sp. BC1]
MREFSVPERLGVFGLGVAANPLIVGLAVLTAAVPPLLLLRASGVLPPPVGWSDRARRRTGWGAGLLAGASWLSQLHRLGLG